MTKHFGTAPSSHLQKTEWSEQSPPFLVSSFYSIYYLNACLTFIKRLLRFNIFGIAYAFYHVTPFTSWWTSPLRDTSLQTENERKRRKGRTRNERAELCTTVKGFLNHFYNSIAFPFLKKKVSFYFNHSSPGQHSHFFSQGSHQQPLENRAIHRPGGAGERLWLESPWVSYGRSLSQSFSACHSFL